MIKKLKENDVYSFTYKSEVIEDMFMPYHCFDRQLVVKKGFAGVLGLYDTYWSSYSVSKVFTVEEALEKGKLKFKCNLDNVEEINKYELVYYDDKDIFDLSYQHKGYKRFVLKKGAKRSKEKMMAVIKSRIEEAVSQIKYLERDIESLKEKEQNLLNGERIYL